MLRLHLAFAATLVLFGNRSGIFAQSSQPADAATRVQQGGGVASGAIVARARGAIIGSTGICSAVRQQAPELLRAIGAGLSPASLEAARRLAGEESGSPTAQSWHDEAVMIYLRGNMPLAAWTALTAAIEAWQERFIADAGTILLGLGRTAEGVQFLRCGYESGDHSPYLLEALAAGDDKLGKRADARQAIDEIDSDSIDDPVIAIEKSFLDTGKPPPPASPQTDELQNCLSRLDKHMAKIVASVRARNTLLDSLLHTPNQRDLDTSGFVHLRATMTAAIRTGNALASAAVSPTAAVKAIRFNSALLACMGAYATFTSMDIDDLLQVSSSSENTNVFFWSTVVGLSPDAYVDDTPHNYTPLERRVAGGPLNSISDFKIHRDDLVAALNQAHSYLTPTYCEAWQAIHDRLAAAEKARFDDAATHGIDDAATQWVSTVEAELADTEAFLSREAKQFRPPLQNWPKIAAGNVDRMQATNIDKLKVFVHARGDEFLREREALRHLLEEEQRNINAACEKALNPPNFDQLAQDEWQNVLAHFSSDYDSDLDCDLKFGGAKVEWNEKEITKLSIKMENVKAKIDLNKHQVAYSGTWKWEVPGSASSKNAKDEAEVSVSPNFIEKDGSLVGVGVDAQVEQSGITVKGGVTLISDTNPNTGVKQPAVGFSSTAGLGGKVPGTEVEITCFPGKGAVKVYPRGLLQDAVTYLVAASR